MNSKSLPLIAWVILGLAIVSLLPFAVTAYQIKESQDSLVKQVQQTHLVSVTATADKLGAYVGGLQNLLSSIAGNQKFLDRLNSDYADEVLSNALLVQNDALAIAIYRGEEVMDLVQIAQSKQVSAFAQSVFEQSGSGSLQTVTYDNSDYLVFREKTDDEKYQLFMLVDRSTVQDFLTVPALNDAVLGLSDSQNQIIDGRVNNYNNFPVNLTQLIEARYIGSAADNFLDEADVRQVAAFSRVENTNWVVISQQPADKAEIAREAMWDTAFKALAVVAGVCALFAFIAHRKIITPIQELVAAQKRLLGGDSDSIEGGEIAQLKHAFSLLEKHIQDKDKIKKVSLGRYKITEVISSGAMGTVFKGWDPRLDREIAIKTIKIGELDGTFDRKKLVSQLVSEAKFVAKIVHPNIVTIYDAVDNEDTAFLAMELVEGISLSDYLRQYKFVQYQQVVALAVGILRGLGEAHKHAVIHRDIKPSNVLLGYNGSIKLSDFGIAGIMNEKVSNEGHVLGSPGYIAPEVLSGRKYSEMSDIFSVGVLLYRCLIGYNPFRGPTVEDVLNATMSAIPKPLHEIQPDIPTSLSNVIMSLMVKDPLKRPNSASMVAAALEKELGVHEWKPPFYQHLPTARESSLSTTTLLPETIIRKHMRTNNE